VPVKLTVWGLPLALSPMKSDALRDPAPVGVNVTLMGQLAPAAMLPVQIFARAKSARFAPSRYTFQILSKPVPVLVTVTLWAALVEFTVNEPKERLAVERLTLGTGAGGPPPLPPPQAAHTPTASKIVTKIQPALRRRAMARLPRARRASNPAHSQDPPAGKRKSGGTLNCGVGIALLPAEVVMVNVAVTAAEPVKLREGGATVQDPPGMAVAPQDRFRVPVNPPSGAIVMVEVPDCPGVEMLMVVGFAETLKSATDTVEAGEVEPA